MSQWLCTVAHESCGSHLSEARREQEEAISTMASQFDYSSYDTDFNTYESSLTLDANAPDSNENWAEDQFVKNCLEEIEEEGHPVDGDAWMIVDVHRRFGYGGTRIRHELSNGGEIYGNRVLYSPALWILEDGIATFHSTAIHEMGHNFGVSHADGTYEKDSDGTLHSVSPMATCYTYDGEDNVDTSMEGTGYTPSSFCWGDDNRESGHWCGDTDDPCRHTSDMAWCARDEMDTNAPL